ncbi:MAG: 6-carboxytetrahydropterin synthase, partial [Thermodesulfobacteriota bacterium]
MFELKVISHFAAAHQLKMVAKKCENLHGHNWKIEVCIAGERLNHAGVLIDFGIIKKHLREIVEKLDHRFLNDLEPFKE